MHRQPTRAGQFTAFELIVVIGVLWAWFAIFLLPAWNDRPPEKARRIMCMNNLKQIGLAALMYADAHGGDFPWLGAHPTNDFSDLGDWARHDFFSAESTVYGCPSYRGGTLKHAAVVADYAYIGAGLRDDNANPTENSLAYDLSGNHRDGDWMNVLFIDGHVQGGRVGRALSGWSADGERVSNHWPVIDRGPRPSDRWKWRQVGIVLSVTGVVSGVAFGLLFALKGIVWVCRKW